MNESSSHSSDGKSESGFFFVRHSLSFVDVRELVLEREMRQERMINVHKYMFLLLSLACFPCWEAAAAEPCCLVKTAVAVADGNGSQPSVGSSDGPSSKRVGGRGGLSGQREREREP